VLEWFFMLRKAEVMHLVPEDFIFLKKGETRLPGGSVINFQQVPTFTPEEVLQSKERLRVRLRIRFDKMNQRAIFKYRMLDCVCSSKERPFFPQQRDASGRPPPPPFCPVHCAARLCFFTGGGAVERLTLGKHEKPPGDSFLLNKIREFLQNAKVPITAVMGGLTVQLFGSQSVRRGGAQALALAGWPLDTIKFFGRWLSDAVERYLLEAPMAARGHMIAESMLHKAVGGSSEFPKDICGPNKPQVGSRITIHAWDAEDSSDSWYDVVIVTLAGDNAVVRPIARQDTPIPMSKQVSLNDTQWRLLTV